MGLRGGEPAAPAPQNVSPSPLAGRAGQGFGGRGALGRSPEAKHIRHLAQRGLGRHNAAAGLGGRQDIAGEHLDLAERHRRVQVVVERGEQARVRGAGVERAACGAAGRVQRSLERLDQVRTTRTPPRS